MYKDTFVEFPTINTSRLNLRQLTVNDTDAMYEYTNDEEAFIYTDGFPIDYDGMKKLISIWNNQGYNSKTFIRWGIEHTDEKILIGGIYLFAPQGDDVSGRRMDIGYDISREYWNKGYATEAIKAITEYGLKNMELKRIQAQIIPENIGSIRACEKAGFVNEGTLRNFCHYQEEGRNGKQLNTMVMMSCIPSDLGL